MLSRISFCLTALLLLTPAAFASSKPCTVQEKAVKNAQKNLASAQKQFERNQRNLEKSQRQLEDTAFKYYNKKADLEAKITEVTANIVIDKVSCAAGGGGKRFCKKLRIDIRNLAKYGSQLLVLKNRFESDTARFKARVSRDQGRLGESDSQVKSAENGVSLAEESLRSCLASSTPS